MLYLFGIVLLFLLLNKIFFTEKPLETQRVQAIENRFGCKESKMQIEARDDLSNGYYVLTEDGMYEVVFNEGLATIVYAKPVGGFE